VVDPCQRTFIRGPGIIHTDGRPSHHWDEARRVNSAVMALGPHLLSLTSTNATTIYNRSVDPAPIVARLQAGGCPLSNLSRGAYIIGCFERTAGDGRALMLVNYEHAYNFFSTVHFDVPPSAVQEVNQVTGVAEPFRPDAPHMLPEGADGSVIILRPGEGRLFLVGSSSRLKTDEEQSPCTVSRVLGCFADCGTGGSGQGQSAPPCRNAGEHRLLGTAALSPAHAKTHESCLEACCHLGISGAAAVAGLEDNGQCFCGDVFSPPANSLRPAAECAAPCSGNATQPCGKESRIVVLRGTCSTPCKALPPPPPPFVPKGVNVFNSSITPEGSLRNVTCYRGAAIVQTPTALVAFAQGRIGHLTNTSFTPSCDDCVHSGIATRRSTDGEPGLAAVVAARV